MHAAATTTTDSRLSAHTTLRLGGPATRVVRAEGAREVADAVARRAEEEGTPLARTLALHWLAGASSRVRRSLAAASPHAEDAAEILLEGAHR